MTGGPWPEPPFVAFTDVESLNVRRADDPAAPAVGLLRHGDPVRVLSCVPACAAPRAWARLDPLGAVRLEFLATETSAMGTAQSALAEFQYASVPPGGVAVYLEPDRHARVVARLYGPRALAFRARADLPGSGWLQRPAGGFVPAEDVRPAQPSAFSGVADPAGVVAFLVEEAAALPLARHATAPVRGVTAGGDVRVPGGTVERRRVRLATARPRPAAIPADARWVHVDIREQVLTAYEGDRWVRATLVSTGRAGRPTPRGIFTVQQKLVHSPMQGNEEAGSGYFVDEVPHVLALQDDVALHGTFWHDAFGTPVSHGCINLSLADARWLFGWAPPALPRGWHGIMPAAAGLPTLWVVIERAPRVVLPLT